jgi:hypothetical protein
MTGKIDAWLPSWLTIATAHGLETRSNCHGFLKLDVVVIWLRQRVFSGKQSAVSQIKLRRS